MAVWYNNKQVRGVVGGFEMAKVICESCGSSFPFEVIKEKKFCPVCNHPLFDDMDEVEDVEPEKDDVDEIDFEHPDLYFYSIDSENRYKNKDLREVWCQCTSCKEVNTIPYNNFNTIEENYLKLKKDLGLTCKSCGKQFSNIIVPRRPEGWRKLNSWEIELDTKPKCPICSSTKVHKISLTNKAASAIAFGVLAAGHVSKTYKCDVCGSKF